MSTRSMVRILVVLLIALALGGAYSIVAKNQAADSGSEPSVGFSH